MKKRVFAISMAGLTAASALLSGCGASGNTGTSGTTLRELFQSFI